jgi:diadenosine tetraphosphate (Ap4A) HIT family hydrolase
LFFEGNLLDGYLLNGENGFGSTMMIWRNGHVCDLVDLDRADQASYWSEVLSVSRRLMEHFHPLKVHYFTHGNEVPHLQTLIMMRYEGDGVTNGVLYWQRGSSPHDAETMEREAQALRTGGGS